MTVEKIIDLSNPESYLARDIHIHKDTLHAALLRGDVRIWDIASNSIEPEILKPCHGSFNAIHADDNHIYLGSLSGRLVVFDRFGKEPLYVLDFRDIDGTAYPIRTILQAPEFVA